MIKLLQIKEASKRIEKYIHLTPILTSSVLNDRTGADLFFKCENFQKSGSFKIRGVTNTVLQLTEQELEKGVVTVSSGNHGAALAKAVAKLGISPKVIMPKNTPKVKVDNVIRNGGEIIWCEPSQVSRNNTLNNILQKNSSTLVHPYDDNRIIEGQGTAALELLNQISNLDMVVTPVSGGGLLTGTLCSIIGVNKDIKVYGAEPVEADDAYRSLISGYIEKNETTNTICDGLRAQIGKITFPIIKDNVNGIFTLTEQEIIISMRLIWETMKIIVEPSCSIALAAVIKNRNIFEGKRVGIILSGGNVDLNNLPW